MFLMEIKIAFRNFLKRPFLNLIKVAGLSLALSGILVIVMYLKNELTYDTFHFKSDRIYRFTITNPGFLEGKHFARIPDPAFII
jgi:putative ABC transport system permease protein